MTRLLRKLTLVAVKRIDWRGESRKEVPWQARVQDR